MGAESERVRKFGKLDEDDNGAGLGASHQARSTGVVADAILRQHGAVVSMGDVRRAGIPSGGNP